MKTRGGKFLTFSFWALCALALGLGLNLALGPTSQPNPALGGLNAAAKPVQAVVPAHKTPLSRYRVLLARGLFRMSAAEKKPVRRLPLVELPKLDGYRLVGLMAGSQQSSWAVVEEAATGYQQIVGEGDKLGPGRVVAVLADRLEIELGGQRHQLSLSDRTMEEMTRILTVSREALSEAGLLSEFTQTGSEAGVPLRPAEEHRAKGAWSGSSPPNGGAGQALGRAEERATGGWPAGNGQ